MKLRVSLPTHVLVEDEASAVTACGGGGHFTVLPRHIDCASALEPGILEWRDARGLEHFAALDAGVLVKVGDEVSVAATRGARGGDLGELRRKVEEEYRAADERARQALTAMGKLEAGFVRRFMELQEHGF